MYSTLLNGVPFFHNGTFVGVVVAGASVELLLPFIAEQTLRDKRRTRSKQNTPSPLPQHFP